MTANGSPPAVPAIRPKFETAQKLEVLMWSRAQIVASLVLRIGIVLGVSTPASAQPWGITWPDFEKTTCAQSCKWQWVEGPDGFPVQVCTAIITKCGYRIALPDGDLIDVSIERGVVGADSLEFRLTSDVSWWKSITIGSGVTGDRWRVWTENRASWCNWPDAATSGCNTIGEWAWVALSGDAFIEFSKAKEFGFHKTVYVLRNLAERLRPGDRVTFRWRAD